MNSMDKKALVDALLKKNLVGVSAPLCIHFCLYAQEAR